MKITTDSFIHQAKKLVELNQVHPTPEPKQKQAEAQKVTGVISELIAGHKKLYGSQEALSELQTKKMGLENLRDLIYQAHDTEMSQFNLRVKMNQIVETNQFNGRKVLADFVRKNQSLALQDDKQSFFALLNRELNYTNYELNDQLDQLQQIEVSQQNLLSLHLINKNEADVFVQGIQSSDHVNLKAIHTPQSQYEANPVVG